MNEKYFDLFSSLEKKAPFTQNSRVLLIDGLNSFIRAYAASPTTSEHGYHIGGVTGFLLSVGYAIRNINPTQVIIVFDGKGGSKYRKSIYPDYKAGRKSRTNIINNSFYNSKNEEEKAMQMQMHLLVKYLKLLPIKIMSIDGVEADDVMAYLNFWFKEKYESEISIMSTDKDFYQLIDDKTTVWSPSKKKVYTTNEIQKEFEGLHPNNFIYYKALIGDSSDNIPGVKGLGLKTLKKRMPILFEHEKIDLNTIFEYAKNEDTKAEETKKATKYKIYSQILENKDVIATNYKLMQLHESIINNTKKSSIMYQLEQPTNRLTKHTFIAELVEDGLNTFIKAPDVWLRETFNKIDNFTIIN